MTGVFLVLSCEERETGKGKPFLTMRLRYPKALPGRDGEDHAFEEVPAKAWEGAIGEKIPKKGEVISCYYKEDQYQGKAQVIIEKYVIQENYDLADFREPPAIDVDAAYRELYLEFPWEHSEIKEFFSGMTAALASPSPWPEYTYVDVLKNIPAGERNHHARRGGLLQHIQEMCSLAQAIYGQGPSKLTEIIDIDVLQAAILLHDLGKVCEYNPETLTYESTRVGEYLGHPAWGMLTVEMYWPKQGDQHLKLKIMHAVISHHGAEVSEVSTLTPEAIILHEIDGISARLDAWQQAEQQGDSPRYSSMLKGTPITPLFPTR